MPDQPTVILTPGAAGGAYDWDLVVPLLPTRYRVWCLERPVLDGRDSRSRASSLAGFTGHAATGLPTLREEAERLAAAADQRGGAIVVAHSMSALHAEAMGRLHPHSLRGLVLVDPSYGTVPRSPRRKSGIGEALSRRAAPFLTSVVPALWTIGARFQTSHALPPSVRAAARARFRSPAMITAAWQEYLAFDSMLRDLFTLREETTFPSVPVWILTATGGMPTGKAVLWMNYHERLVESLAARQRLLPGSRHYVAWDHPQLVARTIETVADELR